MADLDVREAVRRRYAEAALRVLDVGAPTCGPDGCCGTADAADPAGEEGFGAALYAALDVAGLPDAAVLASLGCGNPIAVASLSAGETVLDLGSGAGLDVLLSARRVGPKGLVYGLDMTDEMLELAERNLREAGADNVRFLKGHIEAIPLPDASVDVVISNCVINLSVDKPGVFRECHRVLREGGRFAVTDMVALVDLDPDARTDLAAWSGCIAGALTVGEYRSGLAAAGFRDIEVEVTHEYGGDVVSAVIRATA